LHKEWVLWDLNPGFRSALVHADHLRN